MRKLTEKLIGKLLPTTTGKAAPERGACYSGCGGDGVWLTASSRRHGGKPPCC